MADLSALVSTLKLTIEETAQGVDAMKHLVSGCNKAKVGYEKCTQLMGEGTSAQQEAVVLMRPTDGSAALYGAPPPSKEDSEPSEERDAMLKHLRAAAVRDAAIELGTRSHGPAAKGHIRSLSLSLSRAGRPC